MYHSPALASSNYDVTVRLFSSFFGEEMDVPRCRLEPDRRAVDTHPFTLYLHADHPRCPIANCTRSPTSTADQIAWYSRLS
jgi:hypothetical protein